MIFVMFGDHVESMKACIRLKGLVSWRDGGAGASR